LLRRLRIENLVLIREAELAFAPGLNAITGETGAGKTILAQAVGLLLGARGDAGLVGPAGDEAYVEAELDLPPGLLEEDEDLAALAELRPGDEPGAVLARRVFADGRTRAYAWGRAAAREDVGVLGERLIGMSGQFQQRRLARPAYQLELLDSFAGAEQLWRRAEARSAWRALQVARRRYEELRRGSAESAARLAELRALAEATEGLEPGREGELSRDRERLRHTAELAAAAAAAAEALAPEDGEGAAGLAAAAARGLAPVESLAPELAGTLADLRDAEVRLREGASALRSFLASLEADPGRLEHVEAELHRLAEAKRRFGSATYDELLAGGAEARAELAALAGGEDPAEAAATVLAAAEERLAELAAELREVRRSAAGAFAGAVSEELRELAMGDGEFTVELRDRRLSATGADEVAFLVRPNPGLPPAPVAETASGGELSRIALAVATVAAGRAGAPQHGRVDPAQARTLVFDELDAGIGGHTANAVGRALARLAGRAHVVTITHLPQIASVAARHFRVEKVPGDPTHTRIELLDEERRREEIERMLGGQEFLATLAGGERPG
jgi:DNA repair protein RecN (Recombination protein N)